MQGKASKVRSRDSPRGTIEVDRSSALLSGCGRMIQLPDNSWEETVTESGGVRFHTSIPFARWKRGEGGVAGVRLILDYVVGLAEAA